jgi:pimeloyl-ACP methyl ester carboxylesterase
LHALIEGRRVAYDFTPGPAGAPVIAFVHGLAASKEVWAATACALASHFGVLRYDLRGHGCSDPMDAPCSRSDLARDLVSLMDRLELPRAALVGHSAGGVVAMQAAVDFPARVSGLVLVATASACNDRTAEWYSATAERARGEGGEAAMKAMGVRGGDAPVPDGGTFAQVALAMRSLNRDPLTETLRSVRVPTLIVVGEKDFLGVGGSVILSRVITGSELEIRPGRGHGIYLEEPEWFAERLAAFLTSRVVVPSGCGS